MQSSAKHACNSKSHKLVIQPLTLPEHPSLGGDRSGIRSSFFFVFCELHEDNNDFIFN